MPPPRRTRRPLLALLALLALLIAGYIAQAVRPHDGNPTTPSSSVSAPAPSTPRTRSTTVSTPASVPPGPARPSASPSG